MARRRVYRRNSHRIGVALILLVWGGLLVFLAVYGQPALALSAVLLLLAVPFLLLAYRMFRIGVFASADGVFVRNVLNSRRIPWSEVERFDWGIGMSPKVPVGGVHLRDGSFVRAIALSPLSDVPYKDRAVRRALAGLNAELDRARAAGMPPGKLVPDADAAGAQQLELDQ